ncbi:MAG TPA: TSUP family transporter [Candidatus Acidoferrum sp.]|nr:TSUP family transporter [Candidatus Acidoferrum sp.]
MPDSSWRLFGIFLAACFCGISSGLIGVGGGVILVPLLVLLFHFEQHRAQGTSLIALVPPTGALGLLVYYHAHQVDIRVGALIIPGVFFGGILGGYLATSLSPRKLRLVFALFLLLLGGWEIATAWKS